MRYRSASTVFMGALLSAALCSAESLRIVDYNITASGGSPRTGLDAILQGIGNETVAGEAEPIDLLTMEEIQSQSTTAQTVASMLDTLYGTTAYAHGSLNGATTGAGTQGVVYNSNKLTLIGEAAIGVTSSTGAARQTLRYEFQPVGGSPTNDFYVYVSHLKSADDTADAARRAVEVASIRADADSLGQGADIIYAGDFNVYRSTEPGVQDYLAPGNGQAFDPVNRIGSWHNNASFVDVDTQAPAVSPPSGLTGGGLDDRFDFQLVSGEVLDGGPDLSYTAGSYHTFGNNGSVPLNGNINDPSSTALAGLPNRTAVLNDLTTVTDHLPVVADYTISVPEPMGLTIVLGFGVMLRRRRVA